MRWVLDKLGWGGAALAALLVAVPFLPVLQAAWPYISAHDTYRQFQIALSLLAGLLVWARSPGRPSHELLTRNVRWALSGLAVLCLVAAFLAELQRWALLEWAHYWLLGCLALAVARIRLAQGEGFDRRALGLVLAGVGVYAALTLLFYLVGLSQLSLQFDELRLFPAFNNQRFFGHFQTLTFPFLSLALIQAQSPRIKVLTWGLLLWWWLLVFAAGTRGTVLGVGGAVALLALLPDGIGRPWLRMQVVGAVSGWLAYLVLFRWLPVWLGTIEGAELLPVRILGLSAREVLWEQALQFTMASPWFGIGPMHLARYPTGVGAHPHSLPLQLLAEWGIVAAVLALSLLVWGLWRLYRLAGRETGSPLHLALFAALAGAFIQSLVDGVHVMPYSQMLVAIAAGWALALASRPGAAAAESKIVPGLALAMRGLTLVAMLALVVGVAPEISRLEQWEMDYKMEHADPLWRPRFWLQGLIDGQGG